MKTEPMAHQREGQRRLDANRVAYGLGAEQGTGKTWMLLNDMERQFIDKRINGALVLAPKGVHTNWVRREIPKHMSIPVRSEYYLSGMGVRHKERVAKLMAGPSDDAVLDVLAINIDAINTQAGFKAAEQFLMSHDAIAIIDESSRIKNLDAERTKRAIRLGRLAKSRRIASGTMIANSPLDIFAQFEFLAPGKGLLGTKSYRAFVAEFAELLPPDSPLMQNIARRSAFRPQIVSRDQLGRPRWKNLDRLQQMIEPHVYRVLKKDCLDLPEKIYKTTFFELSASQRRVYNQVRDEMRYERDSGQLDIFNALTKLTKLRQITSGFIMVDGLPTRIADDNPRLDALLELVEDVDGQFIVWATFREELRAVADALRKTGLRVVEYHGGVADADREHAVDAFQRGDADVFVGQPQSGGIGLTLTNAQTAIYFSCDFSLEQRLQSEDRAHRIGTRGNVVYIDVCATDTIDERIALALQAKADVASAVLDGL